MPLIVLFSMLFVDFILLTSGLCSYTTDNIAKMIRKNTETKNQISDRRYERKKSNVRTNE